MKINRQVENILSVSHRARNDDKELLIIYMQKFGMELTDKQVELFKHMPSAESITRARRNIQEQGKYVASDAVDKHRFDRYMNFKHEREFANL